LRTAAAAAATVEEELASSEAHMCVSELRTLMVFGNKSPLLELQPPLSIYLFFCFCHSTPKETETFFSHILSQPVLHSFLNFAELLSLH